MEAKIDPFAWQVRAICRGMKTSIFFADERDGTHSRKAYKAICAACPVRQECLNAAIIYDFEGVWGGYDEIERRAAFPGWHEQFVEELQETGEYVSLSYSTKAA